MAHHARVTPDLRKEIVRMKVSGMTHSAISRDVRRSKSVVSRVLKLYKETKGFEQKKATGRPRKTTMRDIRAIKRKLGSQNVFKTCKTKVKATNK
ncbi:interleukin-1 receptor type 1-like [Octopus vulgaris]|uniref:Interleukin-1 receptor type 1-like n=1 Tax=Octopus vulgaris TaxID=6645 RepID=A0AA36AWW9_OCTVU|nr:interleukin-1 receptor type 1-like [Octopus vulgaris]